MFSSLLPHLLQTIERTNFFSKMRDVLGFFKLCIFTTNNVIDFYRFNLFRIIENILALSYHSFCTHWAKIIWYTLTNVYLST